MLVNKQMIKTGMEDIPNDPNLIKAIKKKQALAGFLADLNQIRVAYARSAYQNSTVSNDSKTHQTEMVKAQNAETAAAEGDTPAIAESGTQLQTWDNGEYADEYRALTEGKSMDELYDAMQQRGTELRTVREHLNLAERFSERIHEIGEQIKVAFAEVDVNDNAAIYQAAKFLQESHEEIQQRWDKAVAAATRNYNAEKIVERAMGAKENAAGEGDVQRQALGLTDKNVPFVDITEDILAGVPEEEWRKKVKDTLRAKFPNGIRLGRNDVIIDGSSRKELTFSKYTKWLASNFPAIFSDKMRATNNADEILQATQNWINEGPLHPRTDRIKDFARGTVLIRVGGNGYSADVIVATLDDGTMRLYDIVNLTPETIKEKETDTAPALNPSPGSHRKAASFSAPIVADTAEEIKPQNADAQNQTWDNGEYADEYRALTEGKSMDELYDAMQQRGTELRTVREQLRERKPEYDRRLDESVMNGTGSLPERVDAFNRWYAESGYEALDNQQKKLDREYRMLRDAYDKANDAKLEADEKAAIEKSGLNEGEYFGKQAVKEFGYTPYFYDAGYILPNGKMLNFSGEKGKHYGSRGQDHRAIGTIFATTTSSEAMVRFMGYGNIRIMAESPGVDIASGMEPTAEQYRQMRSFIQSVRGEEYFNVDLTDERGNTVGNLEYDGTIRPDRIINDIKHYYQTGEVRDTGMSAFYQTWDNEYNAALESGNVDEQQRAEINATMTMQQAKAHLK